jgi:hypothetical protein
MKSSQSLCIAGMLILSTCMSLVTYQFLENCIFGKLNVWRNHDRIMLTGDKLNLKLKKIFPVCYRSMVDVAASYSRKGAS